MEKAKAQAGWLGWVERERKPERGVGLGGAAQAWWVRLG